MSLDDLHAQLRDALDQQFAAVKPQYEKAIADARTQAAADAVREHDAALSRARAEWQEERQALEQTLRGQFEQQQNEAIAAARAETERRVRDDVQGVWHESERRLREELLAAQERLRAGVPPDAQADPGATGHAADASVSLARVGMAVRDLGARASLSQVLDALVSHAEILSGRAAVFVMTGDRLRLWKAAGIAELEREPRDFPVRGTDLLSRTVQTGRTLSASLDVIPPPFATAAPGRGAVAAPLTIDGRVVAVLYVEPRPGTPEAVIYDTTELLARHASAVLALRTAARTLNLLRGGMPPGEQADGPIDDQGARRFARLLVSEIKLYHEAEVRAGCQQGDLMQRLGPEIDHARRIYETRVPAAVGPRHAYFQQELVQTLADGDPHLLGNP